MRASPTAGCGRGTSLRSRPPGHRAIAPSLPGFGDAPALPGGPAPWTEVTKLLDVLGVGRTVLVGNSFGGAIALRVAAVDPERVAGLVLVSAAPTVGERDMPDFHESARDLASRLAGAGPHVVIHGAGHLAPLEARRPSASFCRAF